MFLSFLKKENRKGGFTLVEVLVAVSVIAAVGFIPISIVTQHLIQNALTPNRVKAYLLAQEIIEHVRYTRDDDMLSVAGGNWFDNLYETDSDQNSYVNCVVYADDWAAGSKGKHCKVEC